MSALPVHGVQRGLDSKTLIKMRLRAFGTWIDHTEVGCGHPDEFSKFFRSWHRAPFWRSLITSHNRSNSVCGKCQHVSSVGRLRAGQVTPELKQCERIARRHESKI